jgi:hypothetical protein
MNSLRFSRPSRRAAVSASTLSATTTDFRDAGDAMSVSDGMTS